MRSGPTLEQLDRLWSTLGLDSLGDVSPEGLTSTRARDWEEATVRAGDPATSPPPVPTERDDLPALSLTPPTLGGREDPAVLHRDLRVTGLLGEGGMGRVLLAHQGSLGRDVAVKVPRANATPGALNALLHEAQTTGALEHPGVIPVYSLASDDDGKPALVMKRVDGVSWSMLLRHTDDPAWSRVATQGERIDAHVELLRQVCNAIAYAHRKGVLHRDLKPSNVLIGEFGEVYVADWGIATRKPRPGEHRKPGLVGTPVYMAPEMVSGDDAQMDERTDVFLLGATLYELLTGSPPWSGADLRAVLECAWQCQPKPTPESAPAELVAICRKAMAPEPAHRYQSALEFRDALGGFLRHRGSVKLASVTSERLVALLATLEATADAQVYPLLSECRFGFTMALREWPENEVAREGLARCLVATAQYELRRGNLAAVRALLAELPTVPAELRAELERREAQAASREARLEHLTQEMDPAVAFRQRVLTFLATMVGIAAVVFLPQLVPSIHAAREERWYLTTMMVVVMVFFGAGVWLGRRELLSTRLNRRLIGLVAVAGLGTLAQRALFALFEVSARQTVLHNFLFVTALAITGGLTLHSGFFWSALAMGVGLGAAIVLPGIDGELFGVAAAAALGVAALSWRRWRGEFSIERGE